jgi:hypothetical protein
MDGNGVLACGFLPAAEEGIIGLVSSNSQGIKVAIWWCAAHGTWAPIPSRLFFLMFQFGSNPPLAEHQRQSRKSL